jgi:hypothetical protein
LLNFPFSVDFFIHFKDLNLDVGELLFREYPSFLELAHVGFLFNWVLLLEATDEGNMCLLRSSGDLYPIFYPFRSELNSFKTSRPVLILIFEQNFIDGC